MKTVQAMKSNYKELAEVNVVCLREVEDKKGKVLEMDSRVAKLEEECATTWVKGYFSFQVQAMDKYLELDFDFEPPLGELEEGSAVEAKEEMTEVKASEVTPLPNVPTEAEVEVPEFVLPPPTSHEVATSVKVRIPKPILPPFTTTVEVEVSTPALSKDPFVSVDLPYVPILLEGEESTTISELPRDVEEVVGPVVDTYAFPSSFPPSPLTSRRVLVFWKQLCLLKNTQV